MELTERPPIDRVEIRSALRIAGIDVGENMLGHMLRALGAEVLDEQGEFGERGRPRKLYDPTVVWTIISLYENDKATLSRGSNLIGEFGETALDWEARSSRQFFRFGEPFSNVQFLGQLLLMGSPRYGLDPLRRYKILTADRTLLDYCLYGRNFMSTALDLWDDIYCSFAHRLKSHTYCPTVETLEKHMGLAFMRGLRRALMTASPVLEGDISPWSRAGHFTVASDGPGERSNPGLKEEQSGIKDRMDSAHVERGDRLHEV